MTVKVNLITYNRISELLNCVCVGNLYSNRFVRVSVNWKASSLIDNKGKLTSGVCCHQEIVSNSHGLFFSKLSETMNRRKGY